MQSYEFLAHVLPSGEKCCLRYRKGEYHHNRFFDDLEDMASTADLFSSKGHEVYYVTSSFVDENVNDKGKRSAAGEFARSKKCFYLDIDVGKEKNAYPSLKQAVTGLANFLATFGLPPTFVVKSGAGLHVYWVLDKPINAAVWKQVADRFKAKVIESDLVLDPVVPADVVRILRPVGTTHQKTGQPVEILREGEETTLEAFSQAVGVIADPLANMPAHLQKFEVKTDLTSADYPNSTADKVADNCQFVGAFRASGFPGKGEEPAWYNAIGAIKNCEDGPEKIHKWSSQAEVYSEQETANKIEQWQKGPTTCEKLEEHGYCEGCPHKGHIVAPIVLGRPTTSMEVEEKTPIKDPMWPENYGWDEAREAMYADVWNREDEAFERHHFCKTKFYVETRVRIEDGTWALKVNRLKYDDVWEAFLVPQKAIAKPQDLAALFAAQEVLMEGKHGNFHLQSALRGYSNALRAGKVEVNTQPAMGWYSPQEEDRMSTTYALQATEFIFGPEAIAEDREYEVLLSNRVAKHFHKPLPVAGTAEEYCRLLNDAYNNKASLPYQLVVCAALASPLVPLFGQLEYRGTVLSLVGKTGFGKTTSTAAILGMYTDPALLQISGNPRMGITARAVQNHLAAVNCLPTLLDEVTKQPPQIMSEMVYALAMGAPRVRIDRNGKPMASDERWASNNFLTSNVSLYDMVADSDDSNASDDVTDALHNRIFEINFERLGISQDSLVGDVERSINILTKLGRQYGAAGRVWVKHLVKNKFEIMARLAEVHQQQKRKSTNAASNRFYDYGIAAMLVAAEEARKLGLIKFSLIDIAGFIKDVMGTLLDVRTELEADRDEVFSRYINQHLQQIIYSKRYPAAGGRLGNNDVEILPYNIYGEPIARIASESKVAYFAIGPLKDWCRRQHVDYRRLLQTLDCAGFLEHNRDVPTDKPPGVRPITTATTRVSLTKGVNVVTGGDIANRTHCLVINYNKLKGRGALKEVQVVHKEAKKRETIND